MASFVLEGGEAPCRAFDKRPRRTIGRAGRRLRIVSPLKMEARQDTPAPPCRSERGELRRKVLLSRLAAAVTSDHVLAAAAGGTGLGLL